ncbi:LytR/AlgR family response regulator transcription factor [Arenicella xantha]|uniref:LytTR family two component transcriptional regulator n=1 Tax=Arenicella xantha TaxID=644221 RepID=A0A395JMY5_9GAMM|nr:LytTR family DNA-binding domain-containing protein [Arenicella xantha]RBP52653.1 LytTR family two component transcriptional regulator [Arenicella xantha]
MQIRAAVVDDEPLARARLKRLLQQCDVNVVAEGVNGQEAVDMVSQHAIDILFIDINMPVKNGLQAVREMDLLEIDLPAVCFCTAYNEFALKAFQTNAIAYLLKPVQLDDIRAALTKAAQFNRYQLNSLLQKNVATKSISLCLHGALENVPANRVLCFKAIEKNIFAILDSGEEVLVQKTLKELEQEYSEVFIRVHRNALMNMNEAHRLEKLHDGQNTVVLRTLDLSLPVSRRHLAQVKKCFR